MIRGCSSQIRILDFFTYHGSGVKKEPDPGSATLIPTVVIVSAIRIHILWIRFGSRFLRPHLPQHPCAELSFTFVYLTSLCCTCQLCLVFPLLHLPSPCSLLHWSSHWPLWLLQLPYPCSLLIDSWRHRCHVKELKQCCGSGMFIPDPDFTHPGSRIPNPKTATKERGEKKLLSYLVL